MAAEADSTVKFSEDLRIMPSADAEAECEIPVERKNAAMFEKHREHEPMAAEANWIVEVIGDIPNAQAEAECWKEWSIYKLPACVTALKPKAYSPQAVSFGPYSPQAVSFGPYHHDEKHLKPMEEHKVRALRHFLKRSKRPSYLFDRAVREVLPDLMACYHPLDWKWEDDKDAFLKIMILDGCFMLEILRTGTDTVNDYAPDDPIFSKHGEINIMPYIQRDMLMLENQLPMLVLEKLLAVENETGNSKDEEVVNQLILKFCCPHMPIVKMGKCLHLLDVVRRRLLHEGPSKMTRRRKSDMARKDGYEIIRSATELVEAGIKFKKSKTKSLRDVSFSRGELSLPVTDVDDTTESMFLNLIAFERFHIRAGNEVSSYIFFMDKIIDNERDVALLHSRGIIKNAMGSDKEVAKLFNSLSKDITLDPNCILDVVHKKVNGYCKKPWNMWRANLIHTYFRSPWAMLSLIAAIFLFALTIVQTFYSILDFYQN
ncbi:UPF0481 protein At3g47200-like [Punica granatum]|uniref:Uncharacterized protein n=2 Tax=Punica granatum TaxID=22663 RepID=A0A218WTX2_PUNGR|nr:UPF0481 protein At3g47200-like [Punica granatum]XP_031401888.1 UPF0481 protein At3g47200-like [Punica granatum]XP_031401889.1 UPF0481 protein At3g47200-like [Punica granatum]OWM76304.1 hypothetical protein CDL15_Pgr009950 [Punica granatum]PKI65613.1 hypothetical protein CRG98_014006 [Punica granatum]